MRPELNKFAGYAACKSPDILKDISIPSSGIAKLDANENPYGPSPRVAAALAKFDQAHLYPDATQTELRKALAAYTGMPAEQIVAGAGSDQLIDHLCRLFVAPGDEVISFIPTFAMFRFFTELSGGKFIGLGRDEDFNIKIGELDEAITNRTKLIFLASPNNPTGTRTLREIILKTLSTGLPVVVDEAYYEFSGQTVTDMLLDNPNLLILRTFSKWAGLAGLRVGYGLFPPDIADRIFAIKDPYAVNSAAVLAARESLEDKNYLMERVDLLIKERERLFCLLDGLNFIKPYPSEANFILCRMLRGSAKELQAKLEKNGVLTRYFNEPLLNNFIRFSIGRPEDTDALMSVLNKF